VDLQIGRFRPWLPLMGTKSVASMTGLEGLQPLRGAVMRSSRSGGPEVARRNLGHGRSLRAEASPIARPVPMSTAARGAASARWQRGPESASPAGGPDPEQQRGTLYAPRCRAKSSQTSLDRIARIRERSVRNARRQRPNLGTLLLPAGTFQDVLGLMPAKRGQFRNFVAGSLAPVGGLTTRRPGRHRAELRRGRRAAAGV
jgi:hypothetical protein